MEQGRKCREEGKKRMQKEEMPNPDADPEVLLPNNPDGDNPFVIPEREEDEGRDDYAMR